MSYIDTNMVGLLVAVEAFDLDPGDLGKLTYTVSNNLFAVRHTVGSRTASIIVNG